MFWKKCLYLESLESEQRQWYETNKIICDKEEIDTSLWKIDLSFAQSGFGGQPEGVCSPVNLVFLITGASLDEISTTGSDCRRISRNSSRSSGSRGKRHWNLQRFEPRLPFPGISGRAKIHDPPGTDLWRRIDNKKRQHQWGCWKTTWKMSLRELTLPTVNPGFARLGNLFLKFCLWHPISNHLLHEKNPKIAAII